jgi:hypothetical protein
MIYPQKFLELLNKKSIDCLNKNKIEGLFIKVIN